MVTIPSKARAVLCAALSTALFATSASADCRSWTQSVSWYDTRVDRILDGQEVEHLLTLLHRAQDPASAPDAESLSQLARLVEARIKQLDDIDPPAELAALHQKLIDFHRAALDAAVRPPTPREDVLQPPDRECYRTLLAYFEQLYDDLVSHECTGGDTEALKERVIPQLRAIVAATPQADD
jgi:HPt (histidine-containing phosphotransfer) domain-containing protein